MLYVKNAKRLTRFNVVSPAKCNSECHLSIVAILATLPYFQSSVQVTDRHLIPITDQSDRVPLYEATPNGIPQKKKSSILEHESITSSDTKVNSFQCWISFKNDGIDEEDFHFGCASVESNFSCNQSSQDERLRFGFFFHFCK